MDHFVTIINLSDEELLEYCGEDFAKFYPKPPTSGRKSPYFELVDEDGNFGYKFNKPLFLREIQFELLTGELHLSLSRLDEHFGTNFAEKFDINGIARRTLREIEVLPPPLSRL